MSVPRFWRRINSLYRLEGSKCKKCKKLYFPARERCPKCNTLEVEPYVFSGNGKIITYTWINTPPKNFENRIPYCLAIVELEEGPKITTQIVGVEEEQVEIGMPVEFSFRRLTTQGSEGVITYGFKFRPQGYPNHHKP